MTVQHETVLISGRGLAAALRSRIAEHLTTALSRMGTEPATAHVTFFDDDGPKGGPAIRCAITIHLPHRPAIHVEHTTETARSAFDGAFAVLDRQLARDRERDRDRRRHPKKYYAAKRLVETPR